VKKRPFQEAPSRTNPPTSCSAQSDRRVWRRAAGSEKLSTSTGIKLCAFEDLRRRPPAVARLVSSYPLVATRLPRSPPPHWLRCAGPLHLLLHTPCTILTPHY
jgi:hypothetical protein